MPQALTNLFYPKSVAVIGASRSPEKVGAIVLKNIVESGFKGDVYAVNPSCNTIGKHKCYPNTKDLPETPDLAVVAVPAGVVPEVLEDAGDKGVKNIVVISAGFKEIGEEGKKLEKKITDIAAAHKLNLLGPNCLGFVNNDCPINATFGGPPKETGNLKFISQSGAIAASLFDWCQSTGLGFSEFVTLGNKAVINENHVLEYFIESQESNLHDNGKGMSSVIPVGMYLESIVDGPKFLSLIERVTEKHPVFVIKPGKTEAAAHAMQSHTGAIAGADVVLDSVLKQAGAIRCNTLQDFFDLARALAWEDIPNGPNVAVISNAGGPAVISADAVISEGLSLAQFDDETKKQLMEFLPRSASIVNPVDVLGDALADRFTKAVEVILQKDTVDSLVVILTPQIMTQIEKTAESIGKLSEKYKKPIFCSFIGGSLVAEGEKILNKYKIPSFRFPERAIYAVGAMWNFKKRQKEKKQVQTLEKLDVSSDVTVINDIIRLTMEKERKTLDNVESNEVFSKAGITTPATKHVKNVEEAKTFAKENGWPVVLKLSSPGLLHKRDVGGVVTDIINADQLKAAWHRLEKRAEQLDSKLRDLVRFQVQKEVVHGVEVIVGAKKDPTFGPILLFGAGGSMAEVVLDRNIHMLPMDVGQAKKLIENSMVYKILKGHEGEPPYALDELAKLIVRVGKLAEIVPAATDIEINPVIVDQNDAWAVDGKIVLKEQKKKTAAPKFQTAETKMHDNLATTYHHLKFKTDVPLELTPGQYVSVKVSNKDIRCYSVACFEDKSNFNLLVDTKPGGPGSKFFEGLKEGDKITYMGPFGIFTYKPDDGAKDLLFLGTGSGIAPLRCMIESALDEHKFEGLIKLYIGLNTPDDVFWVDEFDRIKEAHPNFDYEIAIFKPDDSWKGATGFITELVKKDYPDASECAAYLSGNRNMIEDASKILMDNGCPKERIYTEKFA